MHSARHHIDYEAQQLAVRNHRRQLHEQWVQQHAGSFRFDHACSKARAAILVSEAWRLEKIHLQHQLDHCRQLIAAQGKENSSPRKLKVEPAVPCACLKAPVFRLLLPKYRAMNLLLNKFDGTKLEAAVDSLRRTYTNDDDMMQDLLDRYGPEGVTVDPHLWMRSVVERQRGLNSKWTAIGSEVKAEMSDADRFQTIIRNLSIMRIFLEGSQAAKYGCDTSERMRRDAVHSAILDRLEQQGTLFL